MFSNILFLYKKHLTNFYKGKKMSLFSVYPDVKEENVIVGPSSDKSFTDKKTNKTNSYKEKPLSYNYGTQTVKRVDSLNVEGPELKCPFGLKKEINGQGFYEYTAMFRLPLNEPEVKEFCGSLDKIHHACCLDVVKIKGSFNAGFKVEDPESTGFKKPIKYQEDKTSGDRIEGRDPSLYAKLNVQKLGKMKPDGTRNPPWGEKTLFTGLDEKEAVDFDMLIGVEFSCVPVFHLEKIYIGGGHCSIQIKLKSAVLASVPMRPNSISMQSDTIRRLREKNPDLKERLEQQLFAEKPKQLMPSVSTETKEPETKEPESDSDGLKSMKSFLSATK